jgi:hypothetical protein
LDAGDVTVTTESAGAVPLSPRAFPSISSFASGVVYTTRDRESTALPSETRYRVQIAGSETVPAVALQGEAPAELVEVTLGGVPIAQVVEVPLSQPLDFTWSVGDSADLVYVDVTDTAGRGRAVRCTFGDADGAGSIPAEWLSVFEDEPVLVALHRRRASWSEFVHPRGKPGRAGSATLRFDFELNHVVEFVRQS